MITPDDLPFETDEPRQHNLAPRTVAARQRRVRGPNPENQRRGKAARRKGVNAQREWANRIDGKNIGILGDWDVTGPDGCAWEVKNLKKITQGAILDALAQVERTAIMAGRDYGVVFRLADQPESRRWIVVRWG